MIRFKEKALDCKEMIFECSLVGLCISELQTKYRLHIKNHAIHDFSELMTRVKNTKT